MSEEDLRDQELDRLEERRECKYGGCRCCAFLVEARDEIRRLEHELDESRKMHADLQRVISESARDTFRQSNPTRT